MKSLYQKSLQILIENQSKEGAFIACPSFETYQYAWFRDGSFCAHALAQAGYNPNAARFHDWASQIVLRYQPKIKASIGEIRAGRMPLAAMCFHSRFTLDGHEVPGHWGYHQLDGLGTWLWALAEFHRMNPHAVLPEAWTQAAALAAEYLATMWAYPCSDCWEENETKIHTYTLAAIYAGLKGCAGLLNDAAAETAAEVVRTFIFQNCVQEGAFIKSIGIPGVDGNLLGLCEPYHLVEWRDPVFQKTVSQIQADLATPTGIHRYRTDTYYGSGEWLLLTDWLGWNLAQAGETDAARSILAWTEAQASPAGELPEQVPHALYNEKAYDQWEQRWGAVASPLLWSHAMYILLARSIEEQTRTEQG
jgi:GH15 family glucan-1,4-alpha-glucosidase